MSQYSICSIDSVDGYLRKSTHPDYFSTNVVTTNDNRWTSGDPMLEDLHSGDRIIGAATPAKATLQRRYLDQLAYRKIRGFQGTIDENGEYLDEVYQSNRSLTENIASDYRDRFLLELIQNAYDAHPVGTQDGHVSITFDKRQGKNGTLFVANTGLPFAEKNVKSLCDIGLSGKPLGESIGNKGLGFRSVIQITDFPKVYSQCPATPDKNKFSGFCFRFAGPEEFPEQMKDPRHLELALRDLPIFHLPICVDTQTETIRTFAEAGFSTVIELPLRDSDSQDSVQREIDQLCNHRVPVLLFLNRVSLLSVQTINESGQIETKMEFGRSETPCLTTDIELSRVDLGDAGSFLVGRRAIAEATMKDVISIGIQRRELNKHWTKWKGSGEVAVAVRLDSIVLSPRLYTFLPMGEQATAPFSGYLHGSFSPSSNRKNLNARIRLNALLLDEAISLSAKAIFELVKDPTGQIAKLLSLLERATAVVDFLCWAEVDSLETEEKLSSNFVHTVADCFSVNSFNDAPVVPCLLSNSSGGSVTWQPPKLARRWPEMNEIFTDFVAAKLAFETNSWPIWRALGRRIDRLDKYLDTHADEFPGAPQTKERAQLVKLVAKEFKSVRRTPQRKWIRYFQEIPEFMGHDAKSLEGLPVLLGDDGQLHSAMVAAPSLQGSDPVSRRRRRRIVTAVFSPPDPRRASNEDNLRVSPPKKLSRRFSFLPTSFPWHGDLSVARNYLEDHNLVEEFNREAVLAHLSRTLHGENSKAVLRGGLRWAFKLWRQPRSRGRPYRLQPQHRFHVPTLSGKYIEASKAVFSEEWPTTGGKLLQDFLDSAPSGLPDLNRLSDRLLAGPGDLAFRGRWIDDWVRFLSELGVNKGLRPELRSSRNKRFQAYKLTDFSFADEYRIPKTFADFWRKDIIDQDQSLLNLPSETEYVIDSVIAWFPGQADLDRFSLSCKELYARLIFDWLSENHNVPWDIEVHHRYYHQADRRSWPAPLKSFLRSARWLPVIDPTRPTSDPTTVRPCDLWTKVEVGDRFVSYLRRPTRGLRRYLEHAPVELIHKMEEHCGLHIMDKPAALCEQLVFLAEQYIGVRFDRYFERHLLNLYSNTWRLLSDYFSGVEHENQLGDAPESILVRRGQALELMSMLDQDSKGGEHVYVCDTDREGDQNLLEASGKPFFFLREANTAKLGVLLDTLYGQKIRLLSQVKYALLADGENIQDAIATPILDICPHLRPMLAIAMEALSGTEAQRLPSDRAIILTKLERLKMTKAARLQFVIDNMNVSTDQDTVGAFHFKLDDDQSLIAIQTSDEWNWELIDRSIPAICEALDHRALAPHLRLLVVHLRNDSLLREADSHPFKDVRRFTDLLQLPSSASLAAHRSLSAGVERHAPWIRAVLHNLSGPTAVEKLDKESDDVLKDVSLLQGVLSSLLFNTAVTADELLAICRTALGAGDFLDGLGLDFADFNTSLLALDLDPLTHPNLHSSRLEIFIRDKEVEIIECLRVASSSQLNRMHPVEEYGAKRDSLRSLEPDPAWLLTFKEPPEEAMVEHINVWLETKGAPSLGSSVSQLEPLILVREHNRQFIHNFVRKAKSRIRAWCAKCQPEQSLPLLAEEDGTDAILKRLDNIGVLDFRKLDEIKTMKWLKILEIWPADMTLSLDLEVLGLSEVDLTSESVKAREEREARKREERSISLNGRRIDPNDADFRELCAEIQNSLPSNVIGKALGSKPALSDAEPITIARRTTGYGRSSNGRGRRMPEEKAKLIGRLGEFVVYHWLRKILPNQDIDVAWRSENGTLLTGRKGDDSVGYDFEVSYRNQIWQIEVKTSLDDPRSFEIGETEVRAARVAAQHRRGVQYKIAYVSNVSDSKNTNIEVLPNPMTAEGERVLQLCGEGIRYRFNRNQP